MLFTLEALRARFGDALLLYVGTPANPTLIVIDAGPKGVYRDSVQPRLMQLKNKLSPHAPLPIRLLMVSHIDGDHISGVLSLTQEMIDNKTDQLPQPYRITTLWHNSFDDILGNRAETLSAALPSSVQAASSDAPVAIDLPVSLRSALIVADVPQGRTLRNNASALGLLINSPFEQLVMAPKQGSRVVDLGGGLRFTILGPSQQRLEELQAEWDKQLKKMGVGQIPAGVAAEFADKSVANLSSIVVLAESQGKSMLLTGDARGDDILTGLNEAGRLVNGKIRVDLLKMPHHGSNRNVTTDFFRQVVADHYVISADGTHGNPDLDTLKMISSARGQSRFTIHLTNREERLDQFFAQERAKGKQYQVIFRSPADLSIKVDLSDPLLF